MDPHDRYDVWYNVWTSVSKIMDIIMVMAPMAVELIPSCVTMGRMWCVVSYSV